jgi:hypothetical protein
LVLLLAGAGMMPLLWLHNKHRHSRVKAVTAA